MQNHADGFCLRPRQPEAGSSADGSAGRGRTGRLPARSRLQKMLGKIPATSGLRSPLDRAQRLHTWTGALPRPPSVFALAQCTNTTVSHTVWHLNPANRIISPRGQFSRMENGLSLLHQIAVEMFWHQRYLPDPFLTSSYCFRAWLQERSYSAYRLIESKDQD